MPHWDDAWKISMRSFFRQMMAFLFPNIAAEIDPTAPLEYLDKELRPMARLAQSRTARSRGALFVDFLVRVPLRSGKKATLLIHLEIQNQVDPNLEWRMLQYYLGLVRTFGEEVLSLAILGDHEADWRPHGLCRELFENKLIFEFQTVKLLDYEGELEGLLTHPNPFAMLVAAHLITLRTRGRSRERQRAAWKVRLFRLALSRKVGREELTALMDFVDRLLTVPPNLDEEVQNEVESTATEEERMKFEGVLGISAKKKVEAALQAAAQESAAVLAGLIAEKEAALAASEAKAEAALAAEAKAEAALAASEAEKEAALAAEAKAEAALAASEAEALRDLVLMKFGELPASISSLINTAKVERLRQWRFDVWSKSDINDVFST